MIRQNFDDLEVHILLRIAPADPGQICLGCIEFRSSPATKRIAINAFGGLLGTVGEVAVSDMFILT